MRVEFSILNYQRPGGPLIPIAVLLLDPHSDMLHIGQRADLRGIAEEDGEILKLWIVELQGRSRSESGLEMLRSLDETLSNAVQITERQHVEAADIPRALHDLCRRYFGPPNDSPGYSV